MIFILLCFSALQLLRSALVNNVTQAQIFKDIGIAQFVFKHDDLPMQPKECADYVEGNALVFQKSLGCDVVGHGSIQIGRAHV